MMVIFNFWPENIKKASITLQALRLKLNSLEETCTSSDLIMQLISIEIKTVESQLWAKS